MLKLRIFKCLCHAVHKEMEPLGERDKWVFFTNKGT